VIPAGGFLTVDETALGFALSSTGSEVIMLTHSDGVTGQDYFDYGPQFSDVTQGRFPDGTANWHFFTMTTANSPNICDPALPELEHVSNLSFSSSSTFSWETVFDAQSYDAIRGDLRSLRESGGNYSLGSLDCLHNNLAGLGTSDASVPLVGEAFFYIVRAADSSCGFGTYDPISAALLESRDSEIVLDPGTCP
jgi:hypothetical protein